MNHFYLYPDQAIRSAGSSPLASLALLLWLSPAAPTAQLRVIAANPEPVDVAVYDTTGRVLYRTITSPNSTLPLEDIPWVAGAYAVRACQGNQVLTRMLVRE
jgi:hypothetical protein